MFATISTLQRDVLLLCLKGSSTIADLSFLWRQRNCRGGSRDGQERTAGNPPETIRRHQLREMVPLARTARSTGDGTARRISQRFALSPRCIVWDLARRCKPANKPGAQSRVFRAKHPDDRPAPGPGPSKRGIEAQQGGIAEAGHCRRILPALSPVHPPVHRPIPCIMALATHGPRIRPCCYGPRAMGGAVLRAPGTFSDPVAVAAHLVAQRRSRPAQVVKTVNGSSGQTFLPGCSTTARR